MSLYYQGLAQHTDGRQVSVSGQPPRLFATRQDGGVTSAHELIALYRGTQQIWRKWLSDAAMQAILAAFGQSKGLEVIAATNGYLDAIALTDPNKAKALAAFIDEDPMLAPIIIQGTLAYYLNAADGLNDGKWVDRIDPSIQWTPQGSCVLSGDGFVINNGSAYMYHQSTGTDYNLGNHFIVFAEFTPSDDGFIIDFGSITSTNKNISFFKAKNGVANMNWKMQGNNSNPGVAISVPAMSLGNRHYLAWEIKDAGNGKDMFRYMIDWQEYQTAGIIPKATNFGGYTNWENKNFYIGRGVAGAGYSNMVGILHKFLIVVID